MPRCSECGREGAAEDRYCSACGAELRADRYAPGERRKTITVVFSDISGFTSLSERLDPESLRQVVRRYYDGMRSAVERHAGTIHKYVGDGVMAVFGVPTLREDDALRAVTAATGMREELEALNGELDERWGVRLEARTGVNTGEIVIGERSGEEEVIVGDAVNVAARLQQAAAPGEILLGEETYRRVRGAVAVRSTAELDLKGKAAPVAAFRLEGLTGTGRPEAGIDLALVGRDHELALLEEAFDAAVGERDCRVLTVIGAAGVGKSRLTHEFLRRIVRDRARIARGRCLPYGEGITYWPVAEVVKEAADIADNDSPDSARRKIGALLGGDGDAAAVIEPVAAAVGFSEAVAKPEEVFWAVRKLIEALAVTGPLVVVFDDVQWGEPTFLDLVEYLGGFTSGVPVLVLSMARGELLERRPEWTDGVSGARRLALGPLDSQGTTMLIRNLLAPAEAAEQVERRISDAAQGNPLYVEEMLRMLVDDGVLRRQNGRWAVTADLARVAVPPSIQALLAARLERLEPNERGVIERAAIVGEEFWASAIDELSPDALKVDVWGCLQSLVRKGLVRPGGTPLAGEDAFRFGHLLIRDAAYDETLKETRAELHERFADWLERRAGDLLGEFEEIIAYHLEQAHRHREALAPLGRRGSALAARAAAHLASAGRRSLARGDMPAAANLLERSSALGDTEPQQRLELMLDLGHALYVIGDLARADEIFAGIASEAAALGDRRLELRARIDRGYVFIWKNPDASLEDLRAVAEEGIPVFERLGDEIGLAKAYRNLATLYGFVCRWGAATVLLERALYHAERAGDLTVAEEMLPGLATALCMGPMPVDDAIRRLEAMLDRVGAQGSSQVATAGTRAAVEARGLAALKAMRGQVDEARADCVRAKAVLEEVGQTNRLADLGEAFGWIEMLAGRPADAERELRASYETLLTTGDKAVLATVAGELAQAAYAQGLYADAQRLAEETKELAAADDVEAQVSWRVTSSMLLARGGDLERAERTAREAVERADMTETPNLEGAALMALAAVLEQSGRVDAAGETARAAHDIFEAKGNLVAAAGAEGFVQQLAGPG